MKLYTNGCSFTHGSMPFEKVGHTQVYNNYEYTTSYDSTLWPWLLSDNFEFVFNHARYGTGTDRLLRTTIDFLSKLDDQEMHDWIFVLQVSKVNRREYICLEEEKFGQVYPSLENDDKFCIEYRFTDIDCPEVVEYNTDSLSDVVMDYHAMWENNISLSVNQIKNILALQNILDRRNIKYLITGMSNMDLTFYDMHDTVRYSDMLAQFEQMLDRKNIINSIERMTKGTDEYYKEDGHLSTQGNKFFANYIKEEMEKRNWLT
jgi:hypothetical protein